MTRKQFARLVGAFVLGMFFMPATAGETIRLPYLGKAANTLDIGGEATLKRYDVAGERGIVLRNTSNKAISVQDTVTLDTLTLAPGMRIGLSCKDVRHLSLAIGNAVVYESARCGSELRFIQGGQR